MILLSPPRFFFDCFYQLACQALWATALNIVPEILIAGCIAFLQVVEVPAKKETYFIENMELLGSSQRL